MTILKQYNIKKGLLKRKSAYLTNVLKAKQRDNAETLIRLVEGFKNDLNRDIKLFKNVDIKPEYLNTSPSKCILDLFKQLEKN